MRNCVQIIVLSAAIFSCSDNQYQKMREVVIASVEDYVSNQIEFPGRTVDRDGVITIQNNGIVYRIDPSGTLFGDIDGDAFEDAVVTVRVSRMPVIDIPEHIVLINQGDDFAVAGIIEFALKVLKVEDGIIYVETSVVSPDSPMYGCESCREVVQYRYSDGRLVKSNSTPVK